MSSLPDDKPPRVAFGMYKRFAIAGVLITLLTARTVASAGLLEVKDLVSVIKEESQGHVIPGLKGALKAHRIVKKMRGWQKASDHVPVVVELDV